MSGVHGSRFGFRTALLVTGLALLATASVTTPAPGPARAAAALCFTLVAPGATIAGLLRVRSAAAWLAVTVAGSIAVEVLASEAAALASWWQPRALLVALAAVCSAAALLAWRLDRPGTRVLA